MSAPYFCNRIVGGTVVYDDDLEARVRALFQCDEAGDRVPPSIPIQNDAAYLRI